MLFAILFGLSMDYNVFLLSRVHEAYNEGDGPRESVIHGMARIGKVILFAGLIMAAVFLAFVTQPDVIGEDVRPRPRPRDPHRRPDRAAGDRAGGGDAARRPRLVAAGLARPPAGGPRSSRGGRVLSKEMGPPSTLRSTPGQRACRAGSRKARRPAAPFPVTRPRSVYDCGSEPQRSKTLHTSRVARRRVCRMRYSPGSPKQSASGVPVSRERDTPRGATGAPATGVPQSTQRGIPGATVPRRFYKRRRSWLSASGGRAAPVPGIDQATVSSLLIERRRCVGRARASRRAVRAWLRGWPRRVASVAWRRG